MPDVLRSLRAAAAVVALAGCSDPAAPLSAAADATALGARERRSPRAPREGFVEVGRDVRLHYVDYGGSGEPVVLLAGLGNTAHVFEIFAPRLGPRFRVVALTRRGFGASSQPPGPYDTRTLSEDIRAVLDTLRLRRAHLVGHSLAGDEMTRFAGDYPDRVGKLVYLDAAYDRPALNAALAGVPSPPPPPPTLEDLSSFEGFSGYVERLRGVRIPDAELRATFVFASDGTLAGAVTPPEVPAAIVAAEERPDYSRVTAPALGIYAVPRSPSDLLPWLTPRSPEWAAAQEILDAVVGPAYRLERARFDTEVAHSSVLELDGASHYVFLSDAGRVAGAIRAFLQSPGRPQ